MGLFRPIAPEEINLNPFDVIGKQWMLITAGNAEKFNTMTASWGNMGIMWNKPIISCYIRPQRYTLEFVEQQPYFTICTFDEQYRKALSICGSKSGRDCNKVAEAGLTPIYTDQGVYFNEAKLVFFCKKIYRQDIDPACFLEPAIDQNYQAGDYHRMFMGEIVKTLCKEC